VAGKSERGLWFRKKQDKKVKVGSERGNVKQGLHRVCLYMGDVQWVFNGEVS
jgi:hypothetical protein